MSRQQTLEKRRATAPPLPPRSGPPNGGGWGPDGARPHRAPTASPSTGAWLLLAAVGMLFLGFTSSYLSRQAGADWSTLEMPGLLWFTTAVLVLSSGLLEWGRLGARRGVPGRLPAAVQGAALLGLLFVVGQLAAWRELAGAGIFLASNPHASFFYVLTAVHGIHVLAGLIWLFLAAARVKAGRPRAEQAVRSGAIYWHFVGVLWVYLWILLFWI